MQELRIKVDDGIPYGIAFQMILNILHIAKIKGTTCEKHDMIYSDGTKCTITLTEKDNIKTISVCKTQSKRTES